jgi:hypothetical protein
MDNLLDEVKKYAPKWSPVYESDADGEHLLFMVDGSPDTLTESEMREKIKKLGGLRPTKKSETVKWKKGMKVQLEVRVCGISTYQDEKISRVTKKGVYVDNGEGNDESGPFDLKTGRHILIDEVGLGFQRITPKKS